jgi:hypothetical protein
MPSLTIEEHLLVLPMVRELQVFMKVKQRETISGNISSLRLTIIAETKLFLRGVSSGATDDQLQTIVRRIRDKEVELLQQEGAVLDPEMWRILHSRLMNRNLELVDPSGE